MSNSEIKKLAEELAKLSPEERRAELTRLAELARRKQAGELVQVDRAG
ncbi:MAG: hypothetical protein R3A44_10290 [Caldilineaceae bacterium]